MAPGAKEKNNRRMKGASDNEWEGFKEICLICEGGGGKCEVMVNSC